MLCWAGTLSAQNPGQPNRPPGGPDFDGPPPGFDGPPPRRGPGGFGGPGGLQEHRKIVAQFDKDGDKRLNATERKAARDFLAKEKAELRRSPAFLQVWPLLLANGV